MHGSQLITMHGSPGAAFASRLARVNHSPCTLCLPRTLCDGKTEAPDSGIPQGASSRAAPSDIRMIDVAIGCRSSPDNATASIEVTAAPRCASRTGFGQRK
jgi:hypothetical protein